MARAALHDRIVRLLADAGVPFEERRHAPARTAEEAARVRGTPLSSGAKSLVLKMDATFALFVVPGGARLASREARALAGARRSRFATAEELLALTGCVPGSVPPFGHPLLPLPLYAHRALLDAERLAFTPGVPDASILLAAADWARVAEPRLFP